MLVKAYDIWLTFSCATNEISVLEPTSDERSRVRVLGLCMLQNPVYMPNLISSHAESRLKGTFHPPILYWRQAAPQANRLKCFICSPRMCFPPSQRSFDCGDKTGPARAGFILLLPCHLQAKYPMVFPRMKIMKFTLYRRMQKYIFCRFIPFV